MWTMNNKDQEAKKEILTEWASLELKKALSAAHIKSGFRIIRIIPFNTHVCDKHFNPSQGFLLDTCNK
jgi:hypothetical protein